jgi:hypothetical protein
MIFYACSACSFVGEEPTLLGHAAALCKSQGMYDSLSYDAKTRKAVETVIQHTTELQQHKVRSLTSGVLFILFA